MVEKDSQYIFIYRALFEYWRDWRSTMSNLSRDGLSADIEQGLEERESSAEWNQKHGGFFFD